MTPPTNPVPLVAPQCEISQEVRFAIVIYGGVSLAVYINGVVQELLRMVRATSPKEPSSTDALLSSLKPCEQVYRMLGQALGSPSETPDAILRRLLDNPQSQHLEPVRTRFMVDILSGTSAGGINAIFLAKALANNCESLDQLEQMWISEANILSLINDKRSLKGPLSRQAPPKSLLNSARMYLLLLEALDEMDRDRQPDQTSPLIDKLHLFSTATDITGLRLPIALSDGVVDERRHRNVFHFQHPSDDADGSDFRLEDNPFLAYAARCTSAFPFAFEPMALCDIFSVLPAARRHRDKPYCDPKTKYWQRYYRDYIGSENPERDNERFHNRAFGDGGYLDNKPFSYAIEALGKTHSENPVIRKLLYIEPSPESPQALADNRPDRRPDAVENSLAALVTLPRYETIRQDLERILTRNLQVQRIRRAIEAVEQQIDAPLSGGNPASWLETTNTGSYAVYERLKVASVTDDLVELVCRALEIDPRSGLAAAMRLLVDAWLESVGPNQIAPRRFLLDFDVNYRLRRIRFARQRINQWHLEKPPDVNPELLKEYRAELRSIKKRLKEPHDRLQQLLEKTRGPADLVKKNPLLPLSELRLIMAPEALVARPNEPPPQDALLGWPGLASYPRALDLSEEGCRQRAEYVLKTRGRAALLDEIADSLRAEFLPVFTDAARDVAAMLAGDPALTPAAAGARAAVRHTYEKFESHDSAMFPIAYGSDLEVTDLVDVHRISPDDAGARRKECPEPEHKLKGQALSAFAAFLDEGWRRNDMMWGRLDGAQRLIEIVLPGADPERVALRLRLIERAHEAIVAESLDLSAEERIHWKQRLREFLTPLEPAAAEEAALRRQFVPLRQEPAAALVAESAARATAVTGAMLDSIAEKRGIYRKPFAVLAWTGRILWEFVEVSMPRSWRELFFVYWLQLLMLFGVLILVIGAIGNDMTPLWKLGLAALAVMSVLYIARALLRRYLRGKRILTPATVAAGTALLSVATAVWWANWAVWFPHAHALWTRVLAGAGGMGIDWSMPRTAEAFRHLRFGAGVATVATAIWTSIRARAVEPPSGAPSNPGMALQRASSWEEVERVVGKRGHQARRQMARAIQADYALITAYTLFFTSAGLAAVLDRNAWGWALVAAGALAGAADVVENYRILALLRPDRPDNPRWPRVPSLVKWIAAVASIILFALLAAGVV